MIDIHSHILPNIDDGAENIETSIKMAKIAESEGIKKMIATPHFISEDREINKKDVLEKVKELNAILKQRSIDLEVLPGEEIFLTPDIPELYEKGQILTLCDLKRYILIELPMMSIPLYAKDIIHLLTLKGLTVIIAHPERNIRIQQDINKLKEFIHMGALAQINTLSLHGVFGRRAKHSAKEIVSSRLVHFLATDCHTHRARSPRMLKTKKALNPSYAKLLMCTNPAKVLENQDIKASTHSSYKKGKNEGVLQKISGFFTNLGNMKGARNEI